MEGREAAGGAAPPLIFSEAALEARADGAGSDEACRLAQIALVAVVAVVASAWSFRWPMGGGRHKTV